jgi:hypothetical protein
MKIKDYSIIETEWIKSQIRFLKHQQKLKNYEDEKINFKLEYLTSVAEKLKPLSPIVENAYTKGHRVCKGGFSYIENKRDYINNTIIE